MADNYRRQRDKALWHRCANCNDWPTVDYEESAELARNAQLCVTCRVKIELGTCT